MSARISPRILEIAGLEIGTREKGRNDGARVREYLASVGLPPGNSWCAAFVYWCVREATLRGGPMNRLPRTGGVLKMWERTPEHMKFTQAAPGRVFIMDKGKGLGHCGFVLSVELDWMRTIEGNTNGAGSREGDGVYQRERHVSEALGFIDLDAHGPEAA